MPVSEAELGKLLFFDPILSQNKKIGAFVEAGFGFNGIIKVGLSGQF